METITRDWLLIASLPDVGAAYCQQLRQANISPQMILEGDLSFWQSLNLSAAALAQLSAWRQGQGGLVKLLQRVEQWLASDERNTLISCASADYPETLTQLPDPPPILFIKGNLEALHLPQVALVGSRKASQSGIRQAQTLSRDLSQAGIIVTSGLAQGIDAAAHLAAVEQNKPTIAVVGTGLDRVYPASNRILAQRILETGGAWVSEYAPGAQPLAHHFPRRNRIISGLSLGVVVVEAALRSGSLITARQALEQGREVFAMPGAANHVQAKGCNQLIRDGAVLVTEAVHVVEQLQSQFIRLKRLATSENPLAQGVQAHRDEMSQTSLLQSSPKPEDEIQDEHSLLQWIDYSFTPLDHLINQTRLSVEQINCALLELELLGQIEMVGDGCRRV
ncbi:MAG: DNA-processing protein DprA [Pontibacterium sp.]